MTTRLSRSSNANSAAMGYAFQFIALAKLRAQLSMFDLAYSCRDGMTAYVDLQQEEFSSRRTRLHRRQTSAGGYGLFDLVSSALKPNSDTLALIGSTEAENSSTTQILNTGGRYGTPGRHPRRWS